MENQIVKLTAVSYHNTKPFLYGLENGPARDSVEISLDTPAVGANKLYRGELELGLIPVAVMEQVPNAKIVSNFCIGSNGPVKTVCLYGEVPIEEIEWVYLDHHSRTSVRLLQILFEHHWRLNPIYLRAEPGYREHIKGNIGGLVIGDRTIGMEKQFPYVYDLGEAWHQMTGLPFVYAAWVSTRDFSESFLDTLDSSLELGVNSISKVVEKYGDRVPAGFNLEEYLTKNISYTLDDAKMKGLQLFMKMVGCKQPSFQVS